MNTLIGLLIIAIGSFGQSSSYVPINKVKIGHGKVSGLYRESLRGLFFRCWGHCLLFRQEVHC